MRSFIAAATILMLLCAPVVSLAQATVTPDTVVIEKAKVVSVRDQGTSTIPETHVPQTNQTITAQVQSGPDAGTSVTFENDYVQLSVGEAFYIRHTTNELDGTDYYSVSDPYRLPVLGILAAIFLALLILFGGWQGVRGFVSLLGSIVLIFFALFPAILHGYSPIIASLGVAGAIVVLGSYITHGFNKTTSAAVIGMLLTVLITGVGAYIAVHAAHLSGYTSEEEVSLNFQTRGTLDMVGLLLGGIMIGLLGVLYDIAIGQAVAVEELFGASEYADKRKVYLRALRIGREHIGALVNTLAIAYVGAALPLLLLVQSASYGLTYVINNELFATEIIRILIGSIGLILAVPITTAIAISMLATIHRPTS